MSILRNMVDNTTDEKMINILEFIDADDFKVIVAHLRNDELKRAVDHLRFKAKMPVPDLKHAGYMVLLVKRHEGLE